uniref:GNAT family N-acetyltransferase n=1 Tax=Acetatifactor sp. TaxID=1872090 RepID=UPI0040568596
MILQNGTKIIKGKNMTKDVTLVLATKKDAELIHQMKYEAFLPLYNKYHDDETTPVNETMESVIQKIRREGSDYYLIQFKGETVGAVRISDKHGQHPVATGVFYISPLFILPKFQNLGIGQKVLQRLFDLYTQASVWRLDTIKEETGNCHLYEKCGFIRVGEEFVVNEHMTLVDYVKEM